MNSYKSPEKLQYVFEHYNNKELFEFLYDGVWRHSGRFYGFSSLYKEKETGIYYFLSFLEDGEIVGDGYATIDQHWFVDALIREEA